MRAMNDFVDKQKEGARFVLSAQMLRLTPQQFDAVAQTWLAAGGPGFRLVGVPHRTVQDGEFFISRVTAIKTASQPVVQPLSQSVSQPAAAISAPDAIAR